MIKIDEPNYYQIVISGYLSIIATYAAHRRCVDRGAVQYDIFVAKKEAKTLSSISTFRIRERLFFKEESINLSA